MFILLMCTFEFSFNLATVLKPSLHKLHTNILILLTILIWQAFWLTISNVPNGCAFSLKLTVITHDLFYTLFLYMDFKICSKWCKIKTHMVCPVDTYKYSFFYYNTFLVLFSLLSFVSLLKTSSISFILCAFPWCWWLVSSTFETIKVPSGKLT